MAKRLVQPEIKIYLRKNCFIFTSKMLYEDYTQNLKNLVLFTTIKFCLKKYYKM